MESPRENLQQESNHDNSRTLEVDFSWGKFKSFISEKDDKESKPLYIVGFKMAKSQLAFTHASDNSVFGTGRLHAVSISPDCSIRGNAITLKAQKRFKVDYEYLSQGFSDTKDPVPMTWICNCHFKTWDFVLMDSQQIAVAKFAANVWALKRIGVIELIGKAASNEEVREEVVVTGMTLLYCMMLRANSLPNLAGSLFIKPGSASKDKAEHVDKED
jgi:hypothetical protein